jgi:hypothetical protein
MTWVLIVTAMVNGHVLAADKVPFKTQAECLTVLKMVEQNPSFKEHHAKAVCERAS